MDRLQEAVDKRGAPGGGPNSPPDERARELEAALAAKTALLHEVDHRVKNNLQLISSLMLLQSRRLTDDNARAVMRQALERVSAVATVHRRLFQGDDPQRFDVADFLRDLVGELTLSAGRDELVLQLDLEPVSIPATSAAPLALVVNELVGNALKHAFPDGRAGLVRVELRGGDRMRLDIRDDGVGMAEAPPGFGLTIVELLCKQLRAELALKPAAPGVHAQVSMPLEPA